MKNTLFKQLILTIGCVVATTLSSNATTVTFGFESASELTDNFSYTCENSNGAVAVSTDKKSSGNSSLKNSMGGTGKKSNFVVTKTSYTNISSISLQLASSDKGKTSFAIEYCSTSDFSSGVQTIQALAVFNTLPGMPSSVSNNTFYPLTFSLSTPVSGYLRFTFNQPSSSGKHMWMDDLEITYSAGPVVSSDATLSALTYNGTSVPSFSASTTSYDVELPAGTTIVPTVAATANESHATVNISQATSLPGIATVNVTAEDGTTTKVYTINFTVASSVPSLTSFTLAGKAGTINVVNKTVVVSVPNGTDVTALTPQLAGNNMTSYSPTGAVDFTAPVAFTLTNGATGETAIYTVTVTVLPPMSSNANLSSLSVAGKTLTPAFSPSTFNYTVELPAGSSTAPTVSATAADSKANINITQASSATGVATIVVTAEDGSTQTYRVTFSVALPSSNLTCHETEIYESSNGYNTPLVTNSGREFEVYYVTRDGDSKLCVATTSADKTAGITTRGASDYDCSADDGWFSLSGTGWSSSSDAMGGEFGTMARRLDMDNTCEFTMRFKGYDQFALVARDKKQDTSSDKSKPENNRYLEVYIDGVLQPLQFNSSPSVRRYDISAGEHIVRVVHYGSEKSAIYAFSLRLAYVPKLKRIAGNDSTQNVLQTTNLRRITYFLKNRISDAELTWNGPTATGVSLTKGNNDTLYLEGTANCANGVYPYTISAKDENNVVMSEVSGRFCVSSAVRCLGDTDAVVYEKSAIQPLQFRYYSIDDNAVSWQWTGATPVGLTFVKDEATKTVSITGTPTSVGTFTYAVTLAGANTVIGTIVVESNSPTTVPGASKTMLYLYKNRENKTSGAFPYLISKYNYFARPAGGTMQSTADYAQYDFVVISEDVDADNAEVLSLIDNLRKPVLNMKIFTYTPSRLGWGEPDNGSLSATKIAVRAKQHPIFNHLSTDSIQVISGVAGNKGLMPVVVTEPGGLCLATSAKRGENYTDDGEQAVFIHEVPASVRGAKYMTFPVGQQSLANLTSDGKTLLSNIITYLCSSDAAVVSLPELRITSFVVNGVAAEIDDNAGTINIVLPAGTDLTHLEPRITLADASTSVTPTSGTVVDMSDRYFGVKYTVSDFINRKTYVAKATLSASLDDVVSGLWMSGLLLNNPNGMWVNIYNVSGVLVTTTNSDYDFSYLPNGIYLVATASGSILRVMR
ncbi:MAG: hypothetical protein IJS13_05455 [Paludibacteraceae bacterium]|nr:hypothetical protein [Paludibacteraceae bacterium]